MLLTSLMGPRETARCTTFSTAWKSRGIFSWLLAGRQFLNNLRLLIPLWLQQNALRCFSIIYRSDSIICCTSIWVGPRSLNSFATSLFFVTGILTVSYTLRDKVTVLKVIPFILHKSVAWMVAMFAAIFGLLAVHFQLTMHASFWGSVPGYSRRWLHPNCGLE